VFVLRQYQCLDDAQDVELIIDCGANLGYASAYFLTRFPQARLIALEPDPDNFAVLEANLAPYGDRCRALCSAVWSHPAELVLAETSFCQGRKWKRQVRPARPGEVSTVTARDLGSLLEESGSGRISILRMNIGGAESAVFGSDYEPWIASVDRMAIDLHGEESRSVFSSAIASQGFVVSSCESLTFCTRPAPAAEAK
jgi:FkbM family methyltransferase